MKIARRTLLKAGASLLAISGAARADGLSGSVTPQIGGGAGGFDGGISVPAGGAPAFNPASLSAVKYWLDASAITGVADGGAVTAAKLADKSQFARGALATATALTYRATAGNGGRPAVEFDGSTSVAVSPAFAVASPKRVYLVVSPVAWADQKYVLDGNALDQGSIIHRAGSGNFNAVGLNNLTVVAPWTGIENGIFYLYDARFQGAASPLQVSGQVIETGTTSTGAYAAITIGAPGNQLGGFFANIRFQELIVTDGSETAPQATQIRNYLISKNQLVTRKLLLADGNSLTLGTGSTGGNTYPVQLQPLLTGGAGTWNVVNQGVGGQTTPQMDTQASGAGPQSTDTQLGFYARTVVIGWEITNDLVTNSVSAATGYANVQAFFNHRRAANAAAKLVVLTCLPRTTITGTNETSRQTINANIVANWATFADALVDAASIPLLSDPTNLTYYADGTHLTNAGYALVAAAMAPVVNAL